MSEVVDIKKISKTAQKLAFVEVVCVEGRTHLCGGFWLMKAIAQPEEQRCPECGGPIQPSGDMSAFPDLLIANDFAFHAKEGV